METEDVEICEKCGILYSKDVVLTKEGSIAIGYSYKGKCPVCKSKIHICV